MEEQWWHEDQQGKIGMLQYFYFLVHLTMLSASGLHSVEK
jgi:hypothetical protein